MAEDEKNSMELEDEDLDDVAGGQGNCGGSDTSMTDYTNCCYWSAQNKYVRCPSAADHCSAMRCPRYNATFL